MADYQVVAIEKEQIQLQQFLKWLNITESGGTAKIFIKAGKVKVNGEIEYKRGKRLIPGDFIEVEGYGKFKVTTTP